jgi:5-methylcytosine-specific restriction enzyme A
MARPWAYAFYHSRPWEECRLAYGESVFWICERCGKPGKIVHHNIVWLTPANINDPWITLGWWNLQLVCYDCHEEVHFLKKSATREGFAFDENGDLIRGGS